MSSTAVIESLDHEGRGIARCDGKAIFIEGALPGEEVHFSSYRIKPRFEQATMTRLVRTSPFRVEPRCEFFGVCGGCSMQHLEDSAQVAVKQRVLENALWHIARVKPDLVLPAIHGPGWAYRHRARLTVFKTPSKGVLVGFHEKKSSFIADMQHCKVLPPVFSDLLLPLRELIEGLSVADRVPQIELALGDEGAVLVLRNLTPLNAQDEMRVLEFGRRFNLRMWLQPGGPDSAYPLDSSQPAYLQYSLPDFGVRLRFRPNDFTQVNASINQLLMRRAMQLLDPQPGERIADLFCGLGNFSLPIAARGAHVVGVEGLASLVQRAFENARLNGLEACSEFKVANLFEASEASLDALGRLDKMLIDPPREGALAVCRAMGKQAPKRIVYVSCNPATLARDAGILVGDKGYRLRSVAAANMFPQTSHVESIALFERA